MGAAGGTWGESVLAGGSTEPAARSGPAERFERSTRFWMRAYPPRWRVVRGEELVGVLADIAGPGATSVGARTAFDLVRGGWATRGREHPPLGRWFLYRFAGRRLPAPHLAWARDDIEGALYGVRTYLAMFAWFVAAELPFGGFRDQTLQQVRISAGIAAAIGTLMPHRQRLRALIKHVAPRPGDRLYDSRLVVQDGQRMRTDARSGLAWLAATSGLLLAGSLVSIALAPLGWWTRANRPEEGVGPGFEQGLGPIVDRAPALVVVLAGVLLAVLAAFRVRRRIPHPVEQPHRLLRPVGALGVARTCAVLAVGGLVLALETTGRLVMLAGPLLALVTLVLLASCLAGLATLRRPGAPEVAVIDVLRAVVMNLPPEVDGPVPDVGRVPGDLASMAPQALDGPRHPVVPA